MSELSCYYIQYLTRGEEQRFVNAAIVNAAIGAMAHRRPEARPAMPEQFHRPDRRARELFESREAAEVRTCCATRFGQPSSSGGDETGTSADEAQRAAARRLAELVRGSPALANAKDTDAHRSSGASPVHVAVQHANVHALAVLIGAGADVNARKNNGASALHTAIHAYGQGTRGNPMAGGVISMEEWEGRTRRCFEMLLAAGADVHTCHSSAGGDGFDLVVACTCHEYSRADVCVPLLRRLLALGCRVDSRHAISQSDGLVVRDASAAHWAVQNGHTRCLELLVLAGADPMAVGEFPDGRCSAYDFARDAAAADDDDALTALALVAAVVKGHTASLLRDGGLDRGLITRCREELRRRRQLGERVRRGASAAHRTHARRALHIARDLLEAERTEAGRLCYTDALLFGFGGAASAATGSAHGLPEVALSVAYVGEADEAFEALHNLTHCEQVLASRVQTREGHLLARHAAHTLAAAFPSRAMSWVVYGNVLYEIEEGLSRAEGFDTAAAAHGRNATSAAMTHCVQMARAAPDCAAYEGPIASLARAANMAVSDGEASSYALYCEAVRGLECEIAFARLRSPFARLRSPFARRSLALARLRSPFAHPRSPSLAFSGARPQRRRLARRPRPPRRPVLAVARARRTLRRARAARRRALRGGGRAPARATRARRPARAREHHGGRGERAHARAPPPLPLHEPARRRVRVRRPCRQREPHVARGGDRGAARGGPR
jgi:ankyrin repeat protein